MVHVPLDKLDRFLSVLEGLGLEVRRGRIKKQLAAGYDIISLQDKLSPHQADFIILTQGRIERRRGSLLGLRTYYQSPESLILAKLRMIKATWPRERSLKDRDDIKAIMSHTKVNKGKITLAARRETTLEIFREVLGRT